MTIFKFQMTIFNANFNLQSLFHVRQSPFSCLYRKSYFRRKTSFYDYVGKHFAIRKACFRWKAHPCLCRKGCFRKKAHFHVYVRKPISLSHRKHVSIFSQKSMFQFLHRKACFHLLIGKLVSTFPQESLFPHSHRKACFCFYIEKPASTFSQEILFPSSHMKACFHLLIGKPASVQAKPVYLLLRKFVFILHSKACPPSHRKAYFHRKPVSVFIQESLFHLFCRKAYFCVYIGKSVSLFLQENMIL